MKHFLPALLTLIVTPSILPAQIRSHIYSTPAVPSRDVLERLNMEMAWQKIIPMESRRDGIFSMHLAARRERDKPVVFHLLIQTRSGMVTMLDPETGETIWRVPVGRPYLVTQPLGFNDTLVVAVRGTDLYGLDRETGAERWKLFLPGALSAPPVMDEGNIYTAVGSTDIVTYRLPGPRDPAPVLNWRYRALLPLEQQPYLTRNYVLFPTPNGSVSVMFKEIPKEFTRLDTKGAFLAPPGVHEADAFAYLGSRDSNVYGERIEQVIQERRWRFAAGGPIEETPTVTDEDVFVTARGQGMYRLRRLTMTGEQMQAYLDQLRFVSKVQLDEVVMALGDGAKDADTLIKELINKKYLTEDQKRRLVWRSGEAAWQNRDADRVLAVNPKFVYATDTSGRLLVIDRRQGRLLSRYDTIDYTVRFTNEWTDRIYLAANNGQIVCLHDRAFDTPLAMKRVLELPPALPVKKR